MCCDKCKFYRWHFEWCVKWNCETDGRAVRNCFEKADTPIRNFMVTGATKYIYTSEENIRTSYLRYSA